jgi:integrase
MKRARFISGSVVLDRRRKTWNLLQWIEGSRKTQRLGSLAEFPTKSAARRAAQQFQQSLEVPKPKTESVIVSTLSNQYVKEKIPQRLNTKRTYIVWLKHYVVRKWGNCELSALQARPVELWINSLDLAPKSKAPVRNMISTLWEFAMWRGDITVQRNPMELVTVKNASKRVHKPRSLTVVEFQKFAAHLKEPFHTIALLSVCFGLRISECLALKWLDVDWLAGTINIERRIVSQIVDSPKTDESHRKMLVDPSVLEVLKLWKQSSQFAEPSDWIFASPTPLGRLPWSYAQVYDYYKYASRDAGIGHVTHPRLETHIPFLVGYGRYIIGSAAKNDAPCRHQDNHELWRCFH